MKTKLLLTVLFLLLILANQYAPLDDISNEYTEAGFKRVLVTFAVVRGLNGIISVAQGTEVSVEPVGIGLTFTPGQILDPVNDLIERFSWVVLASGTSIGIQQVLLHVGSWFWFRLTVSLLIFTALIFIWVDSSDRALIRSSFMRLVLIAIVLRFSVPLLTLVNELLYENFLEPGYQASSEQLRQTSLTLGDINRKSQAGIQQSGENLSLFENAQRIYRSATDNINIEDRIVAFKAAAEKISEHTINLIVIFLLQTLIIPLLYLWFILQLLKYLATGKLRLSQANK